MASYERAADLYDLIYTDEKDYVAEARLLALLIREACPTARRILDVGCGTGSHARGLIDAGFSVDGIDLEPSFVEIARAKCPEGSFSVGDMRGFDLPDRYDVVTCLFSAIGYVRTDEGLRAAVRSMRRHLRPGGVLVVDPWFEPGRLTHGHVSTLTGQNEHLTVVRMSRTLIQDSISRLEFEYIVGSAAGIERRSEVHELGLFTQAQTEAAFCEAGLSVVRKPEVLRTRGLYIGTMENAR